MLALPWRACSMQRQPSYLWLIFSSVLWVCMIAVCLDRYCSGKLLGGTVWSWWCCLTCCFLRPYSLFGALFFTLLLTHNLTHLSDSIVFCLCRLPLFCFCFTVEPGISGEEGTMLPFRPDLKCYLDQHLYNAIYFIGNIYHQRTYLDISKPTHLSDSWFFRLTCM